ncbi:hypothetical protein [Wolbachia endosymbiont (group A) of Agelastica alni]|uniref:hypothetical protein n=1 Tax=Wolbachia endosymbiont (group A) of Agelastica alni TaxID=3066130 RepID=UPI00333E4FBC
MKEFQFGGKHIKIRDTSGEGNNCLLSSLLGDSPKGCAIAFKDKERPKKMREELHKFLESSYKELVKKDESIKNTILEVYYEVNKQCQIEGEVMLSSDLIPYIMLLSGIKKVTVYSCNDKGRMYKQEFELPEWVYSQVIKKEEVWGDSNVKERTIFHQSLHFCRVEVISQSKQAPIDNDSAEPISYKSKNDKKPATDRSDAIKVDSSNNTNYNQFKAHLNTPIQETTPLQANNNQEEGKEALAGFKNCAPPLNNRGPQVRPKNNKCYVYGGIVIGLFLGLSIAHLAGAVTLTPVIVAVAVFIVAAVVGALVGYGIGRLCEKVSGQFFDVSITEHGLKQQLV